MEKRVGHIKLFERPLICSSGIENKTYSCSSNNRTECLKIVDSFFLIKPFGN
uniref:Uncharacterized protein n=1 Tax=Arabidopsis thaliana TaxID=3702 RepID=Q0WM26_ARATH|nr:hypothetical protein [Arabidopsis thaliana]